MFRLAFTKHATGYNPCHLISLCNLLRQPHGTLKYVFITVDYIFVEQRFITDKVKSPFTKLGFDDSKAEALES